MHEKKTPTQNSRLVIKTACSRLLAVPKVGPQEQPLAALIIAVFLFGTGGYLNYPVTVAETTKLRGQDNKTLSGFLSLSLERRKKEQKVKLPSSTTPKRLLLEANFASHFPAVFFFSTFLNKERKQKKRPSWGKLFHGRMYHLRAVVFFCCARCFCCLAGRVAYLKLELRTEKKS